MCTVTYLPVNKKEFILTSNRDEDILRQSALPICEYQVQNKTIFYPKDPKANGTWIAYGLHGFTLCLLNGAVHPHIKKGQYVKSRGLVLLDFYNYNNPEIFANQYDFTGIEPFTLIMAYSCVETNKVLLYELKWDEVSAKLINHDSSLPHIWSSVTLYSQEIISHRESWFNSWLENNDGCSVDDILFFHHFGGSGNSENDLVINRGNKKTVSICCICKKDMFTEIIYEDLVNRKRYKNRVINC